MHAKKIPCGLFFLLFCKGRNFYALDRFDHIRANYGDTQKVQ